MKKLKVFALIIILLMTTGVLIFAQGNRITKKSNVNNNKEVYLLKIIEENKDTFKYQLYLPNQVKVKKYELKNKKISLKKKFIKKKVIESLEKKVVLNSEDSRTNIIVDYSLKYIGVGRNKEYQELLCFDTKPINLNFMRIGEVYYTDYFEDLRVPIKLKIKDYSDSSIKISIKGKVFDLQEGQEIILKEESLMLDLKGLIKRYKLNPSFNPNKNYYNDKQVKFLNNNIVQNYFEKDKSLKFSSRYKIKYLGKFYVEN